VDKRPCGTTVRQNRKGKQRERCRGLSVPDSTLERSRMSFMSCKTRSPEDNITSTSCRCSASRCVVANTSATLTTPDNGDRISCDIVANICFALIVSSAHEHIFFGLRDITSELNSGSFRVWVSSPSALYDSGASGISTSWSGHLFEDNTISRHLAPHLISRQPKRKPYSQARNLL